MEPRDSEYKTRYFTAMVLAFIADIFIPFLFLAGFVELGLHLSSGKPAYERIENPWLAGALRIYELIIIGIVILVMVGIIILIMI